MKILFAMKDCGNMTEPMNIMLLSALAKKQGHKTNIVVLENESVKDALERVGPDIMAFSCITGSQKAFIDAAREAKRLQPSIITIFGGPHFTYFPNEITRCSKAIDMICVGEADDAWPELLSSIEDNESLDDITNILTKNNSAKFLDSNGTTKPGFVRPRKTDLDALPFLDRELIYRNTAFKTRFRRVHMASRGCPFRCSYCFEPQFNKLYKGLGKIRQYYSVDRFLDELECLKKDWDTRYLKFYDDVFIPFPNPGEMAWHEEFCSKYPKKIGLPFHILTRSDVVMTLKRKHNINAIRDWKKAGLASITMSIESGSRFVHDHVITRDMSQEDVKDAFKLANDEGVYTFPNTIVAIPAPLIPRTGDPQFDKKMTQIADELSILKKINGTGASIDSVVKMLNGWLPNETNHQKRKFLVDILKGLGLHHNRLDYDIESIMFTLERCPGYAEILTLNPYPGTKATDWCVAMGAFDGDFEKLHSSYQSKSPLTCFTEYEKDVMQNLTLIGTFLALFWGSRNRAMFALAKPLTKLFVGHLSRITRPWVQKLFLWLYTISQVYMHRTRIYPSKYTFRENIKFYLDMVQHIFRKKEKKWQPPKKMILGGPIVK